MTEKSLQELTDEHNFLLAVLAETDDRVQKYRKFLVSSAYELSDDDEIDYDGK